MRNVNKKIKSEIELPDYVKVIDKNTLEVTVTDHEGVYKTIITKSDIDEYLKNGVNPLSGVGRLGGIVGDWQPIQDIVEFLWDIFNDLAEEK